MGEFISKKLIIFGCILVFAIVICGSASAAGNGTNETLKDGTTADLTVYNYVYTARYNQPLDTDVQFTIVARNKGPDDATGVNVTIDIPEGYEYSSANPRQGTFNETTKTWNLGTLANGQYAYLDLILKVKQTGNLTTTATITGDQTDPTPDNTKSCTITSNPAADIQVTQTATVQSPDNVTFYINVTNNGPDTATGIKITDILTNLTLNNYTTTQGTFTNGIWNIGTLTNGQTATLILNTTITGTENIINEAKKTAEDQLDPDLTNDSNKRYLKQVDIAVTQTSDRSNPNYLEDVVLTITTKNNGPDDGSNIATTVILPTGLQYISHSVNKGTYDPITGIWTIGDLNNQESVVLTIIAKVVEACTVENTAEKSAEIQYDPVISNNAQTIILNIPEATYVEVNKNVSSSNPNYHDTITYTITATNQGPDNATGVNINYSLPTGITLIGSNASRGTYSNGVWTIGNLANGETVTLILTALINATRTITDNSLTTTQDQYKYNTTLPDPINFNIPNAADIQVTETTPTTVNFGDQACVFVTAQNNGPDTANNVRVKISLPAGFFYSSHNGGTYNSTTGIWTIGSLANGAYTTLNIIGTILTTNSFTINSSKITENEYDYNLTNDAVSKVTNIDMGNVVSFSNVDDGSSSRITLPFTVYLFDRSYNTFYINVNGLVSFTDTISDYIPDPSIDEAFIAPFWDDIYLTGGAAVYYKVDGDTVTITWVKVPSYMERNNPTKFNTFQLRIQQNSSTGDTIYAFIYGDMEWKVGYDGYSTGKSFAGFGGYQRYWWNYYHTYTTFWTNSESLSEIANQTFWFNHSGVQTASPVFVDPDVEVTQEASTYTPDRRERFNITVTVVNLGPEATSGVQILDQIPDGLRLVSASTSKGTYDSSTGVWDIGNLDVNETVTLTLTVYAQKRGTYVNHAEKISQVEYDPNPDNDASDITITVS